MLDEYLLNLPEAFQTCEPAHTYLKDSQCTKDTPVKHGFPDESIYGKGVAIVPAVPGRTDTDHFKAIYLDSLLPLEEYDKIIILLSGGKDSIACYLKMLELGVPKEKIEFWHHDIDGGNPSRRMDWRCTQNYVRALAQAEGVTLRISWRKNGFFGELYRVGASQPVEWMDEGSGEINQCRLSAKQKHDKAIREAGGKDMDDRLKELGYRMKFPAKSGDLSTRWFSAYLKIAVADAVIGNLSSTKSDANILIVSGERRGESVGRSKYNEMEIHRANAEKKNHRLVHQWRPVIDYSERDVWEVLKRHCINPHPCYRAGWNRCSCAMCIFSTPALFAGIREIYPDEYEALKKDEEILGFTLDNKKDLDSFVGCAKSCVYHGDKQAIHSLITGEYSIEDIYVKNEWMFPAGAFHGAEGGPC